MRGGVYLSIGLLLVIAVAQAAHAQASDAAPLSPEEKTLWVHAKGGGATLWMNTMKADPDGTDTTLSLSPATGSTACDKSASFPIELTSGLVLDTSADILYNIRFGLGSGFYQGTVSTELRSGATIIGTASGAVGPTVAAGGAPAGYIDVKLTSKPSQAELPAGDTLVWTIGFKGTCTSAFLQVSQNAQWCILILPITGFATAASNATNTIVDDNVTAPDGNQTEPSNNGTAASATPTGGAADGAGAAGTDVGLDGNATGNGTADGGKDSPGIGLPILLAIVALTVLARRRRD